jgi:recombination protein RecT
MTMNPSNALAVPVGMLKAPDGKSGVAAFSSLLAGRSKQIGRLAGEVLSAEKLMAVAMLNMERVPKLLQCTTTSVMRCILQSAELGLEPGGALGLAYMIPYGTEATLIVGYKGLMQVAYRSGIVAAIHAFCVFDGDRFEYEEGLHTIIKHRPQADRAARTPLMMTHAVAVIHLKGSNVPLYAVLTREEIDQVRNRSRAKADGPWVTDYLEMAKKTALRRALKYAPMTTQLSTAMALDSYAEGETGGEVPITLADVAEEPEPEKAPAAPRGRQAAAPPADALDIGDAFAPTEEGKQWEGGGR